METEPNSRMVQLTPALCSPPELLEASFEKCENGMHLNERRRLPGLFPLAVPRGPHTLPPLAHGRLRARSRRWLEVESLFSRPERKLSCRPRTLCFKLNLLGRPWLITLYSKFRACSLCPTIYAAPCASRRCAGLSPLVTPAGVCLRLVACP